MKRTSPGRRCRELLVLRLLHLQHDVGARPHVVGAVDDLGAGAAVVVVGDRRVGARVRARRARRRRARASSCTPSGVIATRCSPSLTSRARRPCALPPSRRLSSGAGALPGPAGRSPAGRCHGASTPRSGTVRNVDSMMSSSASPAISGGESCTTGSPRSSVRQIRPASYKAGREEPAQQVSDSLVVNVAFVSLVRDELERPGSSRRRGRRRRSGCRAGPRAARGSRPRCGARSRARPPRSNTRGWRARPRSSPGGRRT